MERKVKEKQKTKKGHEIPVPTKEEFLKNLRKAAKDFRAVGPDVPVLQKIDTPPFDLVNRVKRILEKRVH